MGDSFAPACVGVCVCASLSLCVSICVCLCLCVCMTVCLSVCCLFVVYLVRVCLPVSSPVNGLTYVRRYAFRWFLACFVFHLFVCFLCGLLNTIRVRRVCLFVCLHVDVFVCLRVWFVFIFLSVCLYVC